MVLIDRKFSVILLEIYKILQGFRIKINSSNPVTFIDMSILFSFRTFCFTIESKYIIFFLRDMRYPFSLLQLFSSNYICYLGQFFVRDLQDILQDSLKDAALQIIPD